MESDRSHKISNAVILTKQDYTVDNDNPLGTIQKVEVELPEVEIDDALGLSHKHRVAPLKMDSKNLFNYMQLRYKKINEVREKKKEKQKQMIKEF